jgi:hypothetical protein
MVWHRMAWYPLTWPWYGILSDGMPCIGLVIAWVGVANSGTGIARVRVGKVYRGTLHLAPLLFPSLTLTNTSLDYLVSVLGLLWAVLSTVAIGVTWFGGIW